MKYLLDTNACVQFLRSPQSGVGQHLLAAQPGEVAICSIVKAELLYGAHRSQQRQRTWHSS
ncbi:MAG: PIN domain-containing protein [Thermoguttaceae bacterium]|nr:PIN domain-containing protein [Thermoguttaceae bacterium]